LDYVRREHGIPLEEFHFVDIYNRVGPWKQVSDMRNLAIFETFASIYQHYKWMVHVQTVDDRTLGDHGLSSIVGKVDGLDLSDRSDLSLLLLLIKIKNRYPIRQHGQLTVIVDNGSSGKPGATVGARIFAERAEFYKGSFESSVDEPLLQIADFMAFSINRATHLCLKANRSATDYAFLDLLRSMEINSPDLEMQELDAHFTIADFDEGHRIDRVRKGLE